MNRRVVITGSGFVLPLGDNRQDVLSALREPHGPFIRSEVDPQTAVCPVPGFDFKSHVGRCKQARYLTRGQQLCLAAALRAVDDAGLGSGDLDRAGLFLGLGPNLQARPRQDRALWLLDYLPNTATSVLAEILGAHGENLTIMTACAASTQALGQGFRAVASGLADVALAGGGDSRLGPEGIRAYRQAGVLATGFERPELACRPFDTARCGFASGEGGAAFILESLEHATRRGAPILAEMVSASSTMDGASLTGPDPAGTAASQAVRCCLERLPGDSLCVLAHGTGTLLNDAVEGDILARTVPSATAIAAFKSWIGHLAAACGCAELALGLICAAHGQFPAIAGLENPCRHGLPFLREPTRLQPKSLLLQSFGFGGQNACLGVKPWP